MAKLDGMAIVAMVVHYMELGNDFVSRGKALERGKVSTYDIIQAVLDGRDNLQLNPTTRDWKLAELVWNYFKSIPTNYYESHSYMGKLRQITNSTKITAKQIPMIVSMYSAYLREEQKVLNAQKRAQQHEQDIAKSAHIGSVGDKIEQEVVLVSVHGFQGMYGWINILKFKNSAGQILVWFSSGDPDNFFGTVNQPLGNYIGQSFKICGTVKSHDVYKDVKQTKIIRVKNLEV